MQLIQQKINKSLSPAYRAFKPKRDAIDSFKQALERYLKVIDSAEHEENLKTHLMDLLKSQFGNSHLIEQQEHIDLVIRTGEQGSNAGVLCEFKRHSNPAEMISPDDINRKAMHELVLYFMRQRHARNTDIKFLIICTEYEFYIFDAKQFEREFYQQNQFRRDFLAWQSGAKTDSTTSFFYNDIAKPFIEASSIELTATHIQLPHDIASYSNKKLVELFKVFSPEHFLKVPFANDSNSLNKSFYDELLHVIGLHEAKVGSKRLITRCPEAIRNNASLLENTITKLKLKNEFLKRTLRFNTA